MEILKAFGLPIVAIVLGAVVLLTLAMVVKNYKKCPPNKVLVVYGRKRKDAAGGTKGYRLITGGAAFVYPLLESGVYFGLENFSVETSVEQTPNVDGVPVNVSATANVKVSSDPALLGNAIERMLGKTDAQIHQMLKVTLDGLLRQIVGKLTIEDMVSNREALATQVLTHAQTELSKLGYQIDNFVVNHVGDRQGYIDAMGARRTAEVQRDAKIAKSEAEREATVKSSAANQEAKTAQAEADQKIAEADRNLALKRASFKTETETAQAQANMAGELKRAEIDLELRQRMVRAEEAETSARITLAEQEALRVERELIATTIKPAEAAGKAAQIKATNDGQAAQIAAEANSNAATILATGNAAAAEREAVATRSKAEAQRFKLEQEGEGNAAAEAAKQRLSGLAGAEVAKAQLLADAEGNRARQIANADGVRAQQLAEADGLQRRGEAEGAAILAKGTAEAEGLRLKNAALAELSDGARFMLFVEMLPPIITQLGDAGQKVVAAAFEQVGAGLSRVDSVSIVDLGNGGGNGDGSSPLARFAMATPEVIFGTLAKAQALGLDFGAILEKFGMSKGALDGLLGTMKQVAGSPKDASSAE